MWLEEWPVVRSILMASSLVSFVYFSYDSLFFLFVKILKYHWKDMSTFLMYFRTAWEDYFTVTKPTNPYFSQTYSSRLTPSDTSVYISNSLFISITSTSGNGGALYFDSATYYLVESSSFFTCKTSGYGGAIYFSNSNCVQGILHGVCGYDCRTTNSNNYQFGEIHVKSTISSKNYVNYSSFSRCMNQNSGANHIIGLNCGNVCYQSVNTSLNKCHAASGFGCWPTSDSNSVTCSLTYSTFTDNTAMDFTCIWLNTGGAKYEIKNCNILRNTQVSSSDGIIYTSGTMVIEDSCILENTANRIFYQASSSCTFTLSRCTVDKTTNNGYLTIKNTVTKSFILALNHMSTKYCHSEYDSAGYLTPITQSPSPSPSPSKTQKLYYSCEKYLYQPRLSDFFSLTSVFIFNFIHSYASSYPY
jgi:hypothetical protein